MKTYKYSNFTGQSDITILKPTLFLSWKMQILWNYLTKRHCNQIFHWVSGLIIFKGMFILPIKYCVLWWIPPIIILVHSLISLWIFILVILLFRMSMITNSIPTRFSIVLLLMSNFNSFLLLMEIYSIIYWT